LRQLLADSQPSLRFGCFTGASEQKEVITLVSFHHADRFAERFGDRLGDHGWGWGFFGGLVPLLMFLLLIAVAVWAIVRVTNRPLAAPASEAGVPVFRRDAALDEVRLRYARGELSREEYVQRSRDLGGTPPEISPPEA
jgi:putative membrane protein